VAKRLADLQLELEQCRRSEARLRAFLESASQGLVVADPLGKIVLVNRKAEAMFGYTRDELLGSPLDMLLPERYRHVHGVHVAEYFARPRYRPMGVGMELLAARRDGKEFPVEISLSWVDEDGRKLAFALITDITERKRMEEHLRQAQELESLGVLAGGVAHDFNNLLTGVMGSASMAIDALPPSHRVRDYLQNIVESSRRAANLTRQLLAYAGRGRFVPAVLNLSELVLGMAELLRSSVPVNVQLRMHAAERLPVIEGDESQIRQVVVDLVINAGEAIGEERTGAVVVSTAAEQFDETFIATVRNSVALAPGEYVTLTVTDDGGGMVPAVLTKIFDPFFSTKFTGRGLGLAAAAGIMRRHRGGIHVSSEPGRGTAFKVLFPVARERTHAKAAAPRDLSGGDLVLVVDDEAVVRHTARAALERHGYSVVLAEDGQRAVDLFGGMAEQVSAVLLDMTMPGLSGEETLRALQHIRPDVRVVLSTGYHEAEALRRFNGKGLAGFIQKPYTAAQLAERVKAAREGQGTPR
jgi:PAS domain S-box-containing protein